MSALALAACSAPSHEFADWVDPLPGGTPVHEYPAVPVAARSESIEIVADLAIGERDGDDNYTFYQARTPRTGPDGAIYVLDRGNNRVQVFDTDGEFVASYGRQGQGPGEFTRPSALVLAGDRMHVWDFGNRRVGIWTLDGEHRGELPYPVGPLPSGHIGFDNGETLAQVEIRDEDDGGIEAVQTPQYELVVYGPEIELMRTVHTFPETYFPSIVRTTSTGGSWQAMRVPISRVAFTATHSGEVYTTVSAEYQIRAYDLAGALRWALRVAWPRVPIREDEIVSAVEQARERIPDASRSEVDWPAARPAINRLAVDGHGHLYVYPYPADTAAAQSPIVPVDVFSSAGEHLFSGLIEALRWSDAQGDFVYTTDSDDMTGEERVIRYRLVEPF